jgi:protein-S-isoprenylcysteine O-methyltransferase Ste14
MMTKYEKIFGTGPRGLLISVLLLVICWRIEHQVGLPTIINSAYMRVGFFSLMILLTVLIVVWSIKSLPVGERGNKVITTGAFAYFRHPLYAAFLCFFNFGLAVYLNNYLYIAWAIFLHPIWHWNIVGEEKLMINHFGDDYLEYTKVVSRFVPVKSIFRF